MRYPVIAKAAAAAASLCLMLTLSGCLATTSEISMLRDDIHELQLKLNEMYRNQADLSVKMDSLNTSMGTLTSELQETQNRMSLMGQRLDDVDASFTQRIGKLSEQISGQAMSVAPPPSDLYRQAYGDFSRGKYDLAVTGFTTFLQKYPQSELAAQAQYYLGECHYSQSSWDKALNEFILVPQKYPHSDQVAAAILKQALCLELLNKPREAKELFNSLLKSYPGTSESFTAEEKLKTYQN